MAIVLLVIGKGNNDRQQGADAKACLYKEHATCVLWIKGGGGNTRL